MSEISLPNKKLTPYLVQILCQHILLNQGWLAGPNNNNKQSQGLTKQKNGRRIHLASKLYKEKEEKKKESLNKNFL